MKCIKEKCRYCLKNDFFPYDYICDLSHKTFLRTGVVNCDIDIEIKKRKERLNEIKDYALIIRSDNYE